MGRILLFVIFVIVAFAVIVGVANRSGPLAIAPVVQNEVTEQAVEEAVTAPAEFNETGTLVFYPNNIGPVPYLFYQDQKGNTVAKALVFPGESPNNFSSWAGARVSVAGDLVAEHVVVSSIAYISGP